MKRTREAVATDVKRLQDALEALGLDKPARVLAEAVEHLTGETVPTSRIERLSRATGGRPDA